MLSVVREETGLDAIYIYRQLPLVCVYAFEHVWFTKQGIDCKWCGTESDIDLLLDVLSP